MGVYLWNSDMIYFMNQAAKNTKYYEELASYIIPYVTKESVLCDVGCGLGNLAIELSKYCKKVYAVDISEDVITELKKKLEREQISNVEAICTDVFGWQPEEKVDATVYCMFGTLQEIEEIGRHLNVKQQFIVRRLAKQHRFKIKEQTPRNHRHSAQGMAAELDRQGRPYEYREMSISLDQPFKNLDEAIRFFELYNRTSERVTVEDVKERLIEREDEECPYLFPAEKVMGLIRVSMEDETTKSGVGNEA